MADPEGDSLESARRLREHLASWRGESLLVFDNATNPGGLSSLLPAFGRTQIIITTTDIAFEEFGTVVDVAAFTESEAIDYLRLRTGIDDAAGAGSSRPSWAACRWRWPPRRRRFVGTGTATMLATWTNCVDTRSATCCTRRPQVPINYRPPPRSCCLSTWLSATTRIASRASSSVRSRCSHPRGYGWICFSTLYGRDDAAARAAGEAIDRCQRGSLLSWSTVGHSVMMHRLMRRWCANGRIPPVRGTSSSSTR